MNKNLQIPNIVVYGVLFAIVSGISIWLLVFHSDSPTNWVLWVTLAAAFVASIIKLGFHMLKRSQPSAK